MTSDEAGMDRETMDALRLNYDNVANHPASWLFVADNLRLANRLLEPSFLVDLTKESDHQRIEISGRLQGPILMLRGCALECLLKALYVAEGNQLGAGGRFLAPGGRAHDLVALAGKTSLTPTSVEAALLAYLGHFIAQGRYPIAKCAPEAYLVRADGTRRKTVWSEQDEQEYQEFDKRLRGLVVSASQDAGRV